MSGGLGSRTTAPQLDSDEWQRRKGRYRLAAERAAARDIRVWPYDLIRLLDEADGRVRAEEALRQAERLIIEHHKVGVFEGFHIGDTCPVCAEFQSPLVAAVPVEDKSQMDLSNDPRDPLPLDHGDPQPDGIRENKPA